MVVNEHSYLRQKKEIQLPLPDIQINTALD